MRFFANLIAGWAKIQSLNVNTLFADGAIQGTVFNEQQKNTLASDILSVLSDPRGLWLMGEGASSTELSDEYSTSHVGTLGGGLDLDTDRSLKGQAYSLAFNGTTDYITLGDHADFSFGDGTTEEPFSVCALVKTPTPGAFRKVISKFDGTTGAEQREYIIDFLTTNAFRVLFYQNSNGVSVNRITTTAVPSGWHFMVVTYDGGASGSSTNMNGCTIYMDGEVKASAAANSTGYLALKGGTAPLEIGSQYKDASGDRAGYFNSDMAMVALDGSELDAGQVWRLWKMVEGAYNL